MTEKNDEGRKKLSLSGNKLGIGKKLDIQQILDRKQNARHSVTVEVKRRKPAASEKEQPLQKEEAPQKAEISEKKVTREAVEASEPKLSKAELEKRMRLLDAARELDEKRKEQEAVQAEERAKREAIEAQERAEQEAVEATEAKKKKPKKKEEGADLNPEAIVEAEAAMAVAAKGEKHDHRHHDEEHHPKRPLSVPDSEDEEAEAKKAKTKRSLREEPSLDQNWRKGTRVELSEEEEEKPKQQFRTLGMTRRKDKNRRKVEAPKIFREVIIPETITVQELANRMSERSGNVIKALMKMGTMATINQSIDADTAELVVSDLGHTPKRVLENQAEVDIMQDGEQENTTDLEPRAPIVTVMGHVDHGKTSLLDALRATDVVSGESGGITQHIGAYRVTLPSKKSITFIDTPGHAAFSEMRSRGANVTDIVVLVVAADDGVKDQTIEAIRHAKAAEVPIVVAVNKIDKPEAKPEIVATELLSHDLVLESMGGEILSVEVSAKKRLNLEKLEEVLLLQAEMLELRANPKRDARGIVVESKLDKGKGSVATILVQNGTLRVGDVFVSGAEWGRVRAMTDDHGRRVKEASPSSPVEVLGFNGIPLAGDDFMVVESEAKAREISNLRAHKKRMADTAHTAKAGTLEEMLANISAGATKNLDLIVKGDVHGSVEAINASMQKLMNNEAKVRVIHSGVGAINESDIVLAQASKALVVGFNVRANAAARVAAEKEGIDIRYYSIIYNVIDDVKAMLSGLLAPEVKERFLGYADIRQVFNITKVGKIGGAYVTEGVVKRGAKVRLLRDDVVIHEGTLKTLKRFKDEVKEVKDGYECGLAFENYHDIQEGDRVECFELEEIMRNWDDQ